MIPMPDEIERDEADPDVRDIFLKVSLKRPGLLPAGHVAGKNESLPFRIAMVGNRRGEFAQPVAAAVMVRSMSSDFADGRSRYRSGCIGTGAITGGAFMVPESGGGRLGQCPALWVHHRRRYRNRDRSRNRFRGSKALVPPVLSSSCTLCKATPMARKC